MNLDFQITEYAEWRENKNKCSLGIKEIDKPIHDSQKQINTNRLINNNKTPERLK